MWSLLKFQFPELLSQYRLDKFKPATSFTKSKADNLSAFDTKLPVKPEVEQDDLPWTPVCDLEATHPVVRYLSRRGVDVLEDFFFTPTWRELANKVAVDPPFSAAAMFYDKPRIVTRIMKEGVLQGIIGRAIAKDDNPRYMIIKAREDATMVFNFDNVDLTEQVFIAEGVYDSVILSNSVGQLGLTKKADVEEIPNRVWCLDNQPRSADVVKNLEELISTGESVVLWNRLPGYLQQYKDLNSMFVDGGASKKFLDNYVRNNVYCGEAAKVELNEWAKVSSRKQFTSSKLNALEKFKLGHRRFASE